MCVCLYLCVCVVCPPMLQTAGQSCSSGSGMSVPNYLFYTLRATPRGSVGSVFGSLQSGGGIRAHLGVHECHLVAQSLSWGASAYLESSLSAEPCPVLGKLFWVVKGLLLWAPSSGLGTASGHSGE